MTHRRTILRSLGAGLVASVAGCAGGSGGGSDGAEVVETTDVSMSGSQFDPRNIHVDAGAEVTWTNDDGTGHTVTAASDNWSMDVTVQAGESASHAFEESGVYDVYCSFHGSADLSGMSMKVGVGDASIEEPLGGGGNDEGGAY